MSRTSRRARRSDRRVFFERVFADASEFALRVTAVLPFRLGNRTSPLAASDVGVPRSDAHYEQN
jgi:hypothetical protein